MGIQKPGLLEQLIIDGGLSFVPIQLCSDRGFDITYGGAGQTQIQPKDVDTKVLSGHLMKGENEAL